MSEILAKDYLGDGVYVMADSGGGIWLLANDHKHPTDKIYLEDQVFQSLVKFKKRMEATAWLEE